MSMDGDAFKECDGCEKMAFEPKPCETCDEQGRGRLRFCATCAKQCVSCGAMTCDVHRTEAKREGAVVDVCNTCMERDSEAFAAYQHDVLLKRLRMAS